MTDVVGPGDVTLMSATYDDDSDQTLTFTDGEDKQTYIDFDPKYGSSKPKVVYKDAYGSPLERTTTVAMSDTFDVERVDYPDDGCQGQDDEGVSP